MKTVKKIAYTLLGILLVSVIALVGTILYAEYSGKPFLSRQDSSASETDSLNNPSRLMYDEDGNIAELPGISSNASSDTAADTGDVTSDTDEAAPEPADTSAASAAADTSVAADTPAADTDQTDPSAGDGTTHTYIMNKESAIFHYDTCPDVQNISEENKLSMTGTREDVMGRGYEPCKNCNP